MLNRRLKDVFYSHALFACCGSIARLTRRRNRNPSWFWVLCTCNALVSLNGLVSRTWGRWLIRRDRYGKIVRWICWPRSERSRVWRDNSFACYTVLVHRHADPSKIIDHAICICTCQWRLNWKPSWLSVVSLCILNLYSVADVFPPIRAERDGKLSDGFVSMLSWHTDRLIHQRWQQNGREIVRRFVPLPRKHRAKLYTPILLTPSSPS